jgi:glycosyltransferase involved in cell wall biosynthesis
MNINNFINCERLKVTSSKIAIVITSHNSSQTIFRTLTSILNQQNCKDYIVLISDDCSIDNLEQKLEYLFKDKRILYFQVNFKSVYKNRNYLLSILYRYGVNIEVIVRCDSDDVFYDKFVLSKIEKLFFTQSSIRKKCNFLLGGNILSQDGILLSKSNQATTQLFNDEYLLDRLCKMSHNKSEYELPSCNFIFSKNYYLFYPLYKSAEDHFLLVNSLIEHKNNSFRIDEDLMILNYSLSGNLTYENRQNIYLEKREKLYTFAYKRIICE